MWKKTNTRGQFLWLLIPACAVTLRLEQYVCKRADSHACGRVWSQENTRITQVISQLSFECFYKRHQGLTPSLTVHTSLRYLDWKPDINNGLNLECENKPLLKPSFIQRKLNHFTAAFPTAAVVTQASHLLHPQPHREVKFSFDLEMNFFFSLQTKSTSRLNY